VFITINGKRQYLWRAVDQAGNGIVNLFGLTSGGDHSVRG
jgi:transposase-like protein